MSFSFENLKCFFNSDPSMDELLINGNKSLWLCNRSEKKYLSSPFSTNLEMVEWLQRFAVSLGARLDPLSTSNGGLIESDIMFRWHCLLPPVAFDGPLFSLRRHRFSNLELEDFEFLDSSAEKLVDYFKSMRPIIICGPTGAGKTSLLSSLLKKYAFNERIFLLEHRVEMPSFSPSWIRLIEKSANLEGIGGYPLEMILQESFRLRPDRIVIGEIRGSEARVFMMALDAGHRGVLTTLHASSPEQAARRIGYLSGISDVAAILSETGTVICVLKNGIKPVIEGLYEI